MRRSPGRLSSSLYGSLIVAVAGRVGHVRLDDGGGRQRLCDPDEILERVAGCVGDAARVGILRIDAVVRARDAERVGAVAIVRIDPRVDRSATREVIALRRHDAADTQRPVVEVLGHLGVAGGAVIRDAEAGRAGQCIVKEHRCPGHRVVDDRAFELRRLVDGDQRVDRRDSAPSSGSRRAASRDSRDTSTRACRDRPLPARRHCRAASPAARAPRPGVRSRRAPARVSPLGGGRQAMPCRTPDPGRLPQWPGFAAFVSFCAGPFSCSHIRPRRRRSRRSPLPCSRRCAAGS